MQLHVKESIPSDDTVNFVVAAPPTRSDIRDPCDIAEVFIPIYCFQKFYLQLHFSLENFSLLSFFSRMLPLLTDTITFQRKHSYH